MAKPLRATKTEASRLDSVEVEDPPVGKATKDCKFGITCSITINNFDHKKNADVQRINFDEDESLKNSVKIRVEIEKFVDEQVKNNSSVLGMFAQNTEESKDRTKERLKNIFKNKHFKFDSLHELLDYYCYAGNGTECINQYLNWGISKEYYQKKKQEGYGVDTFLGGFYRANSTKSTKSNDT